MSSYPFADRPLPQWYDDAKFGIFIHWGPYAVPCYAPVDRDMGDLMKAGDWEEIFKWSPYTEWYLNSWSIEGSPTEAHHAEMYGPAVTYTDFVEEFHERARGVDVAHWADLFQSAGAKYVVPVTKHHDGFLMWHSDLQNPFRDHWMAERDHIGELATAVRDRDMRFGVYYSGGLDWTFQPPPVRDLMSLFTNIPSSQEYADYATAHWHELIAKYSPCSMWNDIGWPSILDPSDMLAHFYDAVPDGVVNDRFNMIAVATGQLHADFNTPEYTTTAGAKKWEVCRGIGRSFGYNRMENESTFPTIDDNIWMLCDIVARGGNLLINVGPSADGQIPMAQVVRLTALGWWLRVNAEAIYGTRGLGTATTGDGRDVGFTQGPTSSYAIVRGAPHHEVSFPFVQPGAGAEVRMVGNDRVLPHTWADGTLRITIPDHLPAAPATTFRISG
ncbi:MAG: alpha-L-fucosidase [Actinobacteria bacterium]|nr:alpha-L-fucosidase [Actinomycetota bacterium]